MAQRTAAATSRSGAAPGRIPGPVPGQPPTPGAVPGQQPIPGLPPEPPSVAAAHLTRTQARALLARARELHGRVQHVAEERSLAADAVREAHAALRSELVRRG